jgi:hypothetical protein
MTLKVEVKGSRAVLAREPTKVEEKDRGWGNIIRDFVSYGKDARF